MSDTKAREDAKIEEVLSFWLGQTDERGKSSEETKKRWWKKDEAFDQEIRERFVSTYESIASGGGESWLATPEGRLAYVIVLDQFSRNMFRGSAKMYAADELALQATKDGIAGGDDRALGLSGRVFLYMPLMHSEALADQQQCIDVFAAFAEELPEPLKTEIMGNHEFAIKHMVIVERFGRFPHRNEILGRASTPEEIEFLKQPGSGF